MVERKEGTSPSDVGEIVGIIADPAASYWLKSALTSALDRDPFDAERDAILLSAVLTRHLDAVLARYFGNEKRA